MSGFDPTPTGGILADCLGCSVDDKAIQEQKKREKEAALAQREQERRERERQQAAQRK